MEMIRKYWQSALISVLLAELVGVLSSLLAGDIKTVYLALAKPKGAPPPWIFGVVWPLLYALLGVAAFLIYRKCIQGMGEPKALWLYGGQLAVNFFWPIVFFRWLMLWGAAVVLAVLLALTVAMVVSFFRTSKTAGWLTVPYLLWLLYAFYLNVGVAVMN